MNAMRFKRPVFKRPVRPLRLRIRTYLLLLVLGSAMPFVALSAILAIRAAGAQDKQFGQDVVSVARALSLAVDSSIAPLQSALEALSRSPALARADLDAFHAELTDAAALLGGIVLLSDADGRGVLDSRDPPGVHRTERRASPAYVAAVAAGSRPVVSGIYRSTINGQMVVTVDVPVRFHGPDGPHGAPGSTSLPGVLGTTIDLAAIDALVRRQLLPDTWRGGIIDRDGRYVQRTNDGADLLGQPAHPAWTEAASRATEGWTRSSMPAGGEGYIGFATSPMTGWTVGIGVPLEVVRAPLQQTLLSLLALSAGFAGLGVTLALALARRIARPVDALARLAADPDAAPPGLAFPGLAFPGAASPAGSSGVVEIDAVARALQQSSAARSAIEAEMRAATALSPQFPWTADPAGRLLGVSERIAELTGAPRERRANDGWMSLVHPDDRPGVQAAWGHSIATAEPYDHEFRLRLAGGGWTWFRARAMPRLDAEGRVLRWYGATEDVDARRAAVEGLQRLTDELEARVEKEATAREAAQNRLNQAQRLQALGQLAGGIAHDFNNMLQVVGGALALILRRPDDAARVARLAATAEDATERGAAITGRLLSLTRQGTLRAAPVEPLALLSDMASVLTHTLGAAIAIQVAAAPDLPPLLADRRQLETVLINLAANARDAMPGGGRLTLSAALEFNPQGLSVEVLPGPFIRIEAADTGHGMDAATLARASEPFFTTKDVGRGTGLGLAMARGFVEQSGGGLRIESTPGRGTAVRLWLPCAPGAVAPPSETLRLPRRRGRVLLVEDDAQVRATLAEQLQELGFRVLAAADGAAGLSALMAGAEVAMLVSDLTMPGMDGVALIRAAQRMRPGLPAILLTGYAGGGASLDAAGALDGPMSLMQKPVSAAQLADRIATLVERRGTPEV
jgi:PAS domain S-box-containing protein